jgi:hypothetical protein
MTTSNFLKLFSISLLLIFLACKTNKEANNISTENCKTIGTVKDFTGLDGCSLMIVLENGDKLLPASIQDESFVLRDGQRIKLDYKEIEDAMSVCMAEKASIEITCIELISGKPVHKECFDTETPMSVPWMKEVMKTTNPSSIQKFKFRTDGWAYLFFVKSKQILYDCQGTLLCEHEGLGVNQCTKKFLEGEPGKVIYRSQTENPTK